MRFLLRIPPGVGLHFARLPSRGEEKFRRRAGAAGENDQIRIEQVNDVGHADAKLGTHVGKRPQCRRIVVGRENRQFLHALRWRAMPLSVKADEAWARIADAEQYASIHP